MIEAINDYLTERYKVVHGSIRPISGAGSNSANLNPRGNLAPQLMSSIPELGDLTLNTIVEHIESWKTQASEPSRSPRVDAQLMNPYNEMTSNDRKMFSCFRWFLKQGKQHIVMLGRSKNTYIMLDPTTKLFPNIGNFPKRRASIIQTYRDILIHAYSNALYTKLLVWDMATTRNGEGTLTYPKYSPDEYYEKTKDYFLGDMSFRIEEPSIISEDEEEPAYLHVPNIIEGTCEKLDKWVDLRFKTEDEKNIFRAYICSIFDPANESRQALWLWDMGQTGKTTILNAVAQALGNDVTATVGKHDMKSNFIGSIVYGKRLIIVGDNKNPNLIQEGIIHNALGGDRINIEFKGVTAFSTRIICRMLIGANCKPDIDASVAHEKSRVLVMELVGNENLTDEQKAGFIYGGNESKLIDDLASEVLPFVHKYQNIYKDLAPTHGNLVLDADVEENMYDTITTEETVNFDYIMEKYFTVTNDISDSTPRAIMQNIVLKVYPSGRANNFVVSNFKKHLKTAFDLKESRPRIDGARKPPAWYGVKVNIEALGDVRGIADHPILGSWLLEQEETNA